MTETVVVGFIRSPEGQAAVTSAVEEVRRRSGRLVVVHSARGGDHESTEQTLADDEALEELEGQLKSEGIEFAVRALVRGKEPADDLIEIAESESAVLIVIGLRRRSAVGKLLLGSNSQRILLDANCPVLAVKAD
ncbi:MAG: universal stress protein [Actinomycetes bacterium]